jgi:hypothetical protein
MKIRIKTMVVAALALIFLTALPLALETYVPSEFFRAFTVMGGVDLMALLNKVVIIGVAMAVLVILRGSTEKASRAGLGVSIAYKVFWFLVVLFILGLGNIENLGLAVLGGTSGGATNTVIFDFRLIAFLMAAIVALMIAHALIDYRESKTSRPLT